MSPTRSPLSHPGGAPFLQDIYMHLPTVLQNILRVILHDVVTQLRIASTVWFSQSKVLLFSDLKILERNTKNILKNGWWIRTLGPYIPTIFNNFLSLFDQGPYSPSVSQEHSLSFSPDFEPRPGGSVVSVSDSWPGGCEFDPRLRRTFFPAYFCLSPAEACEKSSRWLWKEKLC